MVPLCGSAPEGVLGCHLGGFGEHFERILGDISVSFGNIFRGFLCLEILDYRV